MCKQCWVDQGASTDLPDGWEDAVGLIVDLYAEPNCGTGGPLHVQLDDFNVEGEWKPWGSEDFEPEAMALAQRICDYMSPLPVEQRAAVLGKWEGYF